MHQKEASEGYDQRRVNEHLFHPKVVTHIKKAANPEKKITKK